MNKKISEIVAAFNMSPHPEGGFYVETYRSSLNFKTERGERSASTAILFLITKDSISHFHRLASDEGWHFHSGSPLKLLQLKESGELTEVTIGPDFSEGQKLQHIVPAGDWFASTSYGDYSLVGCTVSPGFDFEDFEMAKKDIMTQRFPQHQEILNKYCLD